MLRSRLSDIAEIVMGQSPSGETCNQSGDGVPLLNGPTEFGSHHPTPVQFTTNARKLAMSGALLFCVRGSTTGRMNWADQEYAIGRGVAAIQHRTSLKLQPLIRGIVEIQLPSLLQAATGSTFPNVSAKQLANLVVPDLTEKQMLWTAALLGSLDDKIELNRRMNETLEAMARAIFKDWFVDFGPTRAKADDRAPYLAPELWDLFPNALDDEGKPCGWPEEPVHAQAQWVNGAAYKNMHFTDAPEALPVIKIAELKAGVTNNTKFTNTALNKKFRISDGELLFSWSGNPDTSIDTFIWAGGNAWLNQHIFAVRQNGRQSATFLYSMLKCLKPQFTEIARNKQTTGLGHVTQQDLKRLMVCTGTPEILIAFDEITEPIYSLTYSNLIENGRLTQTRDLLLPKLMSGEVRLREAEKAVEAVA